MFFDKFLVRFYEKVVSLRAKLQLQQFAECGDHVSVGKFCDFIPSHIHVGHHVHIGLHASFIASISHIYIGNYVMFGPNVTIRGGNHRTDLIGKYLYEVREVDKLPENDSDVIIKDDVWIGCNVTILKGVTIERGAVVGAGTLVTKDMPPYTICLGVPARPVKFRWTKQEILQHEEQLYPEEERFTSQELSAIAEETQNVYGIYMKS